MGRTVMVTGATSGVGRATALRLAAAGYDVFATARSAEKAEKLRATAAEREVPLSCVLLDVTDPSSCRDAFEQVAERSDGGPWALVNNAGIPLAGAVEDIGDDAARHLLEVNLLAPARLARLVLPVMRRRGEGRIVNISSLGGHVTAPAMGWYCASKTALRVLNDALRMETGPGGVHVVVIEGGGYATGIWERAADGLQRLAVHERSPFATLYRAAEGPLRAAVKLPSPEPMAHAVQRALDADCPRARYIVGARTRVGIAADALTPYRTGDHVKRVALGASRAHPLLEHLAHRWCRPW
ncbi:SDR family NAD(P)-dependent oxidoreductase [Streptomyces sp. NPDC004082]|uniref:SDR family NAD(P)-dependent oxidoreductase n=1 Tax=unclassified Streptomyces TaxID=2593676 RepID=UPI0033BF8068